MTSTPFWNLMSGRPWATGFRLQNRRSVGHHDFRRRRIAFEGWASQAEQTVNNPKSPANHGALVHSNRPASCQPRVQAALYRSAQESQGLEPLFQPGENVALA